MSTAMADEEVHVWRLLACVIVAVLAAVGVFSVTYSLLAALAGYIFVACLAFAILWVIGSAE